jgi:hypothetical protein
VTPGVDEPCLGGCSAWAAAGAGLPVWLAGFFLHCTTYGTYGGMWVANGSCVTVVGTTCLPLAASPGAMVGGWLAGVSMHPCVYGWSRLAMVWLEGRVPWPDLPAATGGTCKHPC